MAPGRCGQGPFYFFYFADDVQREEVRAIMSRAAQLVREGQYGPSGRLKIGSAVGRHRARPAGARRKGLILASQPVRSSSISTAAVDKQPLAGRAKFWWSRGGVWVKSCQPVRSSSIGSR